MSFEKSNKKEKKTFNKELLRNDDSGMNKMYNQNMKVFEIDTEGKDFNKALFKLKLIEDIFSDSIQNIVNNDAEEFDYKEFESKRGEDYYKNQDYNFVDEADLIYFESIERILNTHYKPLLDNLNKEAQRNNEDFFYIEDMFQAQTIEGRQDATKFHKMDVLVAFNELRSDFESEIGRLQGLLDEKNKFDENTNENPTNSDSISKPKAKAFLVKYLKDGGVDVYDKENHIKVAGDLDRYLIPHLQKLFKENGKGFIYKDLEVEFLLQQAEDMRNNIQAQIERDYEVKKQSNTNTQTTNKKTQKTRDYSDIFKNKGNPMNRNKKNGRSR